MKKIILIALYLAPLTLLAQLRVDKVEPPNWWTGMQWEDLQLMVYGHDLAGATARFVEAGPVVKQVHQVGNAHYAFVDVQLPQDLPAGTYTLRIEREGERVDLPYAIEARAAATGRYAGFGPEDVVYLITPDRFANGDLSNDSLVNHLDEYDPSLPGKRHGGDLQGIIDQLDYLADLGVTTLWLNPILENAGENSYHGYACTDLYRVDPRFGTNEKYRELVAAAHERGLKIIFDHVANHIGIHHEWMNDLPTPDWVNGSREEHLSDKHYKLSIVDPYAADNTEELLRSFWFVDAMPDLNQRQRFLAQYLIQNTLWWIEYTGLDGIREDTYPYPFQEFMTRWEKAILAEYPNFNIVGEIWNNEPPVVALFQKDSYLRGNFETHLPSVMDFPLSRALRQYLEGYGNLRGVYTIFAQDFLYADPSNLFTFIDNHDMSRAYFVAEQNDAKIKQALTILLTTRGIPQLLYGTELNLLGGESHVELRQDFPGGFPQHERSAFTAEGRTPNERDIFDFTQQLLQLRQQYPALAQGTFTQYPGTWNNDIYKYLKGDEQDRFLVVVNGHDEEREVDLSELREALAPCRTAVDLLTGRAVNLEEDLRIEALGVWLLKLES
ncbi:MAG: alpha-amylase family glycosyl hydrolase [Bacteroidota bacterium]